MAPNIMSSKKNKLSQQSTTSAVDKRKKFKGAVAALRNSSKSKNSAQNDVVDSISVPKKIKEEIVSLETLARDARSPSCSKELSKLAIRIGKGSQIMKKRTTRSGLQILPIVKKKECSGGISMVVHNDFSSSYSPKQSSVIRKHTKMELMDSKPTKREKSAIETQSISTVRNTPRAGSSKTNVSTSTIEAISAKYCFIREARIAESTSAAVKKEHLNDNLSTVVLTDKSPPSSLKRSANLKKKNKKRKRRILSSTNPKLANGVLCQNGIMPVNNTALSAPLSSTDDNQTESNGKKRPPTSTRPTVKKRELRDNLSTTVHPDRSPKNSTLVEKKSGETEIHSSDASKLNKDSIDDSKSNVIHTALIAPADQSNSASVTEVTPKTTRRRVIGSYTIDQDMETCSGSDSSNNDRSSDENFDPSALSAKRRRRSSLWESNADNSSRNGSGRKKKNKSAQDRNVPSHKGELCGLDSPAVFKVGSRLHRSNARRHASSRTDDTVDDLPDTSSTTALNNKHYKSESIEDIIEKMSNKNTNILYLAWSKKFCMELAAALARSGPNCFLIVQKLTSATIVDVASLSNTLQTCKVVIGQEANSLCLFSFGELNLPPKILRKPNIKSLGELETKLKKFARSQGMEIINMLKHSENKKGWYESLRSDLKEELYITNRV